MTGPERTLAIECVDVTRTYAGRGGRGEVVALDHVSFEVPTGTVFGLLGPNGAGKTTLIRILSTILTPTTGTARVLGRDVVTDPDDVRARIGLVLGGERGLFGQLSGRDNLRYFAALHGMGRRTTNRRIAEVADTFNLGGFLDQRVEQYSRGMRQKLHLARGLLSSPELLFLDEPTIGLDPVSAHELRALVPSLVAEGITVFLSTHYMAEADLLCDRLMVLDRGKLVTFGSPSEIKQSFDGVEIVEVVAVGGRRDAVERVKTMDAVLRVSVTDEGGTVRSTIHLRPGSDSREEIRAAFMAEGGDVQVVQRPPTLEEVYLGLFDAG